MKSTGIIRRIDDLGRIVIPKEIRKKIYGSVEKAEGQPMEFFVENDNTIVLKQYRATNTWEPIVNAHGKLVEFICDCGCSSQAASNYCPDCGTKMDNSDIEERIQEAIHKAI